MNVLSGQLPKKRCTAQAKKKMKKKRGPFTHIMQLLIIIVVVQVGGAVKIYIMYVAAVDGGGAQGKGKTG
jgi:flagellar basal body-associated protein FliL